MAEITAKLVNDLRARTGQPMMKCKQMLADAGGDIDKAIELFRKAGVKASIAERVATEGRVIGAVSADGKTASLVEVTCNTDFTAKSQPLQDLAARAANLLLSNPGANPAQDPTIAGLVTDAAQRTGENVGVGRTAVVSAPEGRAALYLYAITGKIGVIMAFKGNPSDELVTDLGGHIAFSKPLGLTRDAVPADLVAKEREIAVEQAKATGKPQNIAEKIAEGKLNAFFKEQVLLDQDFFNSGKFKGTISDMLKGAGVQLQTYARLEVGQG